MYTQYMLEQGKVLPLTIYSIVLAQLGLQVENNILTMKLMYEQEVSFE